jgi:hypothetical protein
VTAVAAADFGGPDSAAGGAQPERGAGADREVRRRVSRLQAEDLVLMRVGGTVDTPFRIKVIAV